MPSKQELWWTLSRDTAGAMFLLYTLKVQPPTHIVSLAFKLLYSTKLRHGHTQNCLFPFLFSLPCAAHASFYQLVLMFICVKSFLE